jgi:hypothetical protein
MPFLNNDTCAKGGYLFLPGFISLYDAIHGWMTGQTDGWIDWRVTWWKKLHEKQPQCLLLYVITSYVYYF